MKTLNVANNKLTTSRDTQQTTTTAGRRTRRRLKVEDLPRELRPEQNWLFHQPDLFRPACVLQPATRELAGFGLRRDVDDVLEVLEALRTNRSIKFYTQPAVNSFHTVIKYVDGVWHVPNGVMRFLYLTGVVRLTSRQIQTNGLWFDRLQAAVLKYWLLTGELPTDQEEVTL